MGLIIEWFIIFAIYALTGSVTYTLLIIAAFVVVSIAIRCSEGWQGW